MSDDTIKNQRNTPKILDFTSFREAKEVADTIDEIEADEIDYVGEGINTLNNILTENTEYLVVVTQEPDDMPQIIISGSLEPFKLLGVLDYLKDEIKKLIYITESDRP